jgi:hypothetical protein
VQDVPTVALQALANINIETDLDTGYDVTRVTPVWNFAYSIRFIWRRYRRTDVVRALKRVQAIMIPELRVRGSGHDLRLRDPHTRPNYSGKRRCTTGSVSA